MKLTKPELDGGALPREYARDDRVFGGLNSEEMLALNRNITGHSETMSADAQYTRYAPGRFRTRHRDDHASEGRRDPDYRLRYTPK